MNAIEETFYVLIVPETSGTFRPTVLEYGLTFTQASEKVRWYINDHGLRFKVNGETYPALIQIKSAKRGLPNNYRLMTFKEKKNEHERS